MGIEICKMEKCTNSLIKYFVILLLYKFASVTSLQVLGVVGGGAVVNGSSPLLVMDCHYIIPPGEEAGLVVSWYHGPNPHPVYQWIYGSQPQALGILRDRLDLGYQPSPDKLKAHSSLAFVAPTTELAGEYTCRVSTYQAEDSATGSFIVYTPPSLFDLKMSKPSFGKVVIACDVRNVFPEPNIFLFKTDISTKSRSRMNSRLQKIYDVDKNVFSLALESSILGHQLIGETEFECLLTVPGTDYRLKETLLYYPGVIASASAPVAGRSVSSHSGSRSLHHQPTLLTLWLLLAAALTTRRSTKMGLL